MHTNQDNSILAKTLVILYYLYHYVLKMKLISRRII